MAALEKIPVLNPLTLRNTVGGELADIFEARGIKNFEELIGINQRSRKIELLETIRPQYIILKPSLHGGISGSEEWMELAAERGIGSWITSALESNIGLNAIAQWCATLQPTLPQGLGTGLLFTDNINYPLHIEGDCLWFHPEEQEPDLLQWLAQ